MSKEVVTIYNCNDDRVVTLALLRHLLVTVPIFIATKGQGSNRDCNFDGQDGSLGSTDLIEFELIQQKTY